MTTIIYWNKVLLDGRIESDPKTPSYSSGSGSSCSASEGVESATEDSMFSPSRTSSLRKTIIHAINVKISAIDAGFLYFMMKIQMEVWSDSIINLLLVKFLED